MKKVLVVLVMTMGAAMFAQTAPTGGKKVLKVKNKIDNEYSLRVQDAFSDAPYKYHMKRLPKKLLKYGFTNVQITALGNVEMAPPTESIVTPQVILVAGGSVQLAINQIGTKVYHEEFQVNFDSDQGSFKVRLNMTATGIRYIIKEN